MAIVKAFGHDVEVRDEHDAYALHELTVENAYRLDQIHLPPDPHVLDIGAHIGAFALAVTHRFPGAWVSCYELDESNYDLAVRNTAPLSMCQVIHAGIYGGERPAYYGQTIASGRNMLMRHDTHEPHVRPAPPRMMTLAEVLSHASFGPHEPVDLLKIDVEGAELDIFRQAAEDNVLRFVDRIVGEFHRCYGVEFERDLAPIFGRERLRTVWTKGAPTDTCGEFYVSRFPPPPSTGP